MDPDVREEIPVQWIMGINKKEGLPRKLKII